VGRCCRYTFDNVLPYFKRSIQFTTPKSTRDELRRRVQNKMLALSVLPEALFRYHMQTNTGQSFSSYMEGGLNEIGVPTVPDSNCGSLLGAQYCSSTIRRSGESRDTFQTSFLREAVRQKLTNLKVFSHTMAKKILVASNKKGTGVVVESDAISYTLTANKETTVWAGTFQSLQLLMVSGIAPSEQLAKYTIAVVVDLIGVGQGRKTISSSGPRTAST
jgi:choline dehydrogenase